MMDMKFITDDMAKVALMQPAHAIKPPAPARSATSPTGSWTCSTT